MKRVVKFVVALAVLFFLFQLAVTFFVNKHEITYNISHEKKQYSIQEKFLKKDQMHYYSFNVYDENKNEYSFYFNYDYRKQKRIMKDIESYQEGNVSCILPIFKDKKVGSIVCRYENEVVSYDYLKQKGINLSNFISSLQSKGYTIPNDNDTVVEQENVSLYNHFPENFSVALWNYHGLYILNKDKEKNLLVLDDDYYENNLGALVGNYYVIADTDAQFEYNRFYIIDIINQSKDFVDLDISISKDSYILGVYKDDVYILDRDKKIEYTFNIKSRKLKEVGNKDSAAKLYQNGSFKEENIYTVSDQKLTFNENIAVKELEEKYHPIFITESNSKYYFITEDYKVYYVLKDDINSRVLLLQDPNLKDLKVIDDYLFYLSGDSIMMYEMSEGYHKIMTHPELSYNNKNIFAVVKK